LGTVVLEDSAGTVDDLLVALDLRHDLLLHVQRRYGNFVERTGASHRLSSLGKAFFGGRPGDTFHVELAVARRSP
jgi:hypothetical protein